MKYKKIIIDLIIVAASLLLTYLMAEFDLVLKLEHVITSDYILAFLAGLFFISIFTVVPAGYLLVNLLGNNDPLLVALVAGLGAVNGDLLIFLFVKNRASHNFFSFLNFKYNNFANKLRENKIIKIVLPIVGAAIIASPLPDEIGVALMGVSRIKKRYFIPMSYALNTVGIYLLLLASIAL